MIDLSGIEYNFLPGLLWWLIPLEVAGVYLWWMFKTNRQDNTVTGFIGAMFIVLGGVYLLTGWIAFLWTAPEEYVNAEEKRMTIEQLEEQGFANIELTQDRKFTASVNGEYFRGALAHDHGYVYQVVELSVD